MQVSELELDPRAKDVIIAQGITELYPPQEGPARAVLAGKSVVMAVPTASGKSLVAYLACVSTALRGGKAIYIVPLRALASEKYSELQAFESLGLRIGISTGDLDGSDPRLEKYDILVVTSEKADSLFRHRVGWLKRISVVVADEVHLIHDSDRGPTLEVTLARFRRLNPESRVVALSATIRNSADLARWLGAEHFTSEWRPVELRRGVFFDGRIRYEDCSEEDVKPAKTPVGSILRRTLERGQQALVFVNTRRSTEKLAEDMAPLVARHGDAEVLEALGREAGEILGSSDAPAVVSRLLDCIRGGTAFHHAGLAGDARSLVEREFKSGRIRVIAATPTLAAGLNLPARVVVVRDLYRFDSGFGNVLLPVMEVSQMCGRAGRPRYDKLGEAYLIARTEEERDGIMDHYLRGESESIVSKLGLEGALRTHILSSVAMGLVGSEKDLEDFIDSTFLGYQEEAWTLRGRLESVVEFLCNEGMLRSGDDHLAATEFGMRTTQLYVDPMSAVMLRDALRAARTNPNSADSFGYLHAISSTPDILPFFAGSRDRAFVSAIMDERSGRFLSGGNAAPEAFMGQVKTAAVLESWIDEMSEHDICDRFDIYPGDLKNRADTARWLAYAMSELARIFHPDAAEPLKELSLRLEDGIKGELLGLMSIKGVGRVRARTLHRAGFCDGAALRGATVSALASLPGIGEKLAREIIRQAGGRADEPARPPAPGSNEPPMESNPKKPSGAAKGRKKGAKGKICLDDFA